MPIIGKLNIPFHALRPLNLLIAAAVMSMSYYYLGNEVFMVQQSSGFFFTITLVTTILIMMGGYIHNDALDVEADLKNKPHRVYISFYNNTKYKTLAFGLTLGGVSLCLLFLMFEKYPLQLVIAQGIFALLIYLYNQYLKGIALLGNLIIAAMASWAFILPVIILKEINHLDDFKTLFLKSLPVFTFSILSGLITLIRELIKDEADKQGDIGARFKTFACVAPTQLKNITYIFLFSTLALLPFAFPLFNSKEYILLTVALVSVPALICGIFAFFPASKPAYKTSSFLLKLVMINGLILFYVILL